MRRIHSGLLCLSLGLSPSLRAACPAKQADALRIGSQQFQVIVAATPETRERGLSGRARLPRHVGMWFVLPEVSRPGFWMRDMRFPIDLIWVNPELRVAGAVTLQPCHQARCPISLAPEPVAYVLEVAAGQFAGKPGDAVTWACGSATSPTRCTATR